MNSRWSATTWARAVSPSSTRRTTPAASRNSRRTKVWIMTISRVSQKVGEDVAGVAVMVAPCVGIRTAVG